LAQLTQKTNQFNLTTKRYAEGQIRELSGDPNTEVLCLKVRDKVADMGLVGLAIVRYGQNAADVDTFLMSCRVIGRGVEDALLAQVVENAKRRDVQNVVARYRPTPKNVQVKDFYQKRGFEVVEETPEESTYRLVAGASPFQCPSWIKLRGGEPYESK
jgi:FkbH-like protein